MNPHDPLVATVAWMGDLLAEARHAWLRDLSPADLDRAFEYAAARFPNAPDCGDAAYEGDPDAMRADLASIGYTHDMWLDDEEDRELIERDYEDAPIDDYQMDWECAGPMHYSGLRGL